MVVATAKVEEATEQLVQAELPIDEKNVSVMQQALELVTRDYEVRQAELAAQSVVKQGELEMDSKELENLELQRSHATLRAPIDGVVINGRIKPGDVLEPGKAVMEIASQGAFQFEAAVPSEDVGNLRVGMPVRIKFDAYDYQRYGVLKGKVTYISPDSHIEEANGSPTSVAYIVRVELPDGKVGRGDLRGDVKLGLGGTAEIVTQRKCVLMILFKKVRQTISLG